MATGTLRPERINNSWPVGGLVITMPRFTSVTIQRLYENRDSQDQPYWVLQLSNGKRVSTFDQEKVEQVQEGDRVMLDYEQKGKYLNVVSIRKLGSDRESIERQSAARTAAILLQHKSPSPEEFNQWASTVHQFIQEGRDEAHGQEPNGETNEQS